MQLHPRGVFVIYEWRLEDINEHVDDSASEMESVNSLDTHSSHSPTSSLMTASLVTTTPTVTHIVTFKCIGAVRDEKQQKALEHAFVVRARGEIVRVKIEPEPTNSYDSKAVSFMCMVEGSWQRIGYVVRETLDEVHEAIRQRNILWVKFAWVKYLLQWVRSGPGFYAGINIARRGEWSETCLKSASTR